MHKIQLPSNPQLNAALSALDILSKHGEAYLVGGCVRDLVMGIEPHDYDISTNVPMDTIESLFNSHDIGKNKDFGIVVIKHNGYIFEVANFRQDGDYSDGRHPNSIKLGVTFQEDTSRRDFTINALGMDRDGNIIDYHGGLKDIENKVIQTVGCPRHRFQEDALRMIRAIRFGARFGFTIDPNLLAEIVNMRGDILKISRERIKDELMKISSYGGVAYYRACEYFFETDIFANVFNLNGYATKADFYLFDLLKKDVFAKIPGDFISNLFITYLPYIDEMGHKNFIKFLSSIKLSSDEISQFTYLIRGHHIYGDLIDKVEAYDCVVEYVEFLTNEYFEKFYPVFCELHGGGEPGSFGREAIDYYFEFVPVVGLKKLVNQELLTYNVAGKQFGEISRNIVDFLIEAYKNTNNVPSDEFVKAVVKEFCRNV